MTQVTSNFESHFGYSVPEDILKLLNDENLKGRLPTTFRFKNVQFVLGIQYFLDIANPENYDTKNDRLKFAVTTDGFDLIVNLKSLDILQDEFGDVDSIGLSFEDLLNASNGE